MVRIIVEGWLLGLSTGPYCFTACAPVMAPYLMAEGRATLRRHAWLLWQFLLGRAVAYLAFGMLCGWSGTLLQPHVTQQLARVAVGLTAALLLIYALSHRAPQWSACTWIGRVVPSARLPFVLGLLIGINVCPPFLVAAARVLQVGGWASGAVFFLGFFAGTSVYVLPLLSLAPFARTPRVQAIGTLSALLVGGWFLATALAGW